MGRPAPTAARAVRLAIRAHGPVLAAVGVATLWTVLALSNPATTYHVAPALTAAAWPATARVLRGRAPLGPAVRAALGGLLVAVLTIAELDRFDALRGPALIGGSAVVESALVAAAAAAWGARALVRERPGFLLSAFGAPHEP